MSRLSLRFTLEGHFPIACEDDAPYPTPTERQVAETNVGQYRVSTVFLNVDHGFGLKPDQPPILFETMVFGDEADDPVDQHMERYSTWDEAEAGHKKIVEGLKDGSLAAACRHE